MINLLEQLNLSIDILEKDTNERSTYIFKKLNLPYVQNYFVLIQEEAEATS